jgi:hypothetical protein
MYNTQTNTNTYTVVDIRKTFENCEADIRTIARRTGNGLQTMLMTSCTMLSNLRKINI